MYRSGTPTSKIAAWAGVAETTVRYHLQIAAKQDPRLQDERKAALAPPPEPRTTEVGLRNLAEVLAFHDAQGRLPVAHGKTARERALRRITQPHVRDKQAFTGLSAAKDRFLDAAQRKPGLLPRVMPIGGQVEPSAQLKAVPTGL